jgi:hypothetical protein
MLIHDALLFGLIAVGTLVFASVLRLTLSGYQEHRGPHLDARGLLLFVPLIILLGAGEPLDVLVPLMAASRSICWLPSALFCACRE